jgi:hypothetical protein
MFLKISGISHKHNGFGKDILINRIWFYHDDWKYKKRLPLTSEWLLDLIKWAKIEVPDDIANQWLSEKSK